MHRKITNQHPNARELRGGYIQKMRGDWALVFNIESYLSEIRDIRKFYKSIIKPFTNLQNMICDRINHSRYHIHAPNFSLELIRYYDYEDINIYIENITFRDKFMESIRNYSGDYVLQALRELHKRYNYLLGLNKVIELPEIRKYILQFL